MAGKKESNDGAQGEAEKAVPATDGPEPEFTYVRMLQRYETEWGMKGEGWEGELPTANAKKLIAEHRAQAIRPPHVGQRPASGGSSFHTR